jgi:hypothetical protein
LEVGQLGHVELRYGQRHPLDAAAPIVLRDGERRTRVDFVLPRESIISGTVLDEHGEPLEGIRVWAFQFGRLRNRTTPVSRALRPSVTDDRGQYRVFGVPPGQHMVAAMPRAELSEAGTERARGYVSTYYPGTSDALSALAVAVDVGRDAHGVDFSLTPTVLADVSGVARDASGRPVAADVELSVSARSGAVSVDTWRASADTGGVFRLRHVPPGDYVLKAMLEGPRRFGMQYVTIADREPAPVTVVLAEGATLEGRFVIDARPDANLAGLALTVSPVDFDSSPTFVARPPMWARQDDGTFRAQGVTGPSRLAITGTPACETCYLESARVNGSDAADTPFDFGLTGAVYRGVEIVVSDAGAAIEGRAIDDRRTTPAYWVVTIPVYRDLWYEGSPRLKAARSAPDGSFRVTGLPPGDYVVAAVNRFDSMPYGGRSELTDTAVLEDLSARGERVSLTRHERRPLELPLIQR